MKKIICLIAVLLAFTSISYAGGLSIGLGYPYASIKYDFSTLAAEGRFVTDSGVKVYSGRGYWNFYQQGRIKGFTGLEGGYISFNTLDTKGTGYEAAPFIGGEYFINKWLSLLIDFAPTYISLKHADDSSVKVGGVELVANIALYFHFGNNMVANKEDDSSNE